MSEDCDLFLSLGMFGALVGASRPIKSMTPPLAFESEALRDSASAVWCGTRSWNGPGLGQEMATRNGKKSLLYGGGKALRFCSVQSTDPCDYLLYIKNSRRMRFSIRLHYE